MPKSSLLTNLHPSLQVFVLLFSLWVSLVVLVGAFLSVPLAIGRQAFSIVHDKEVHDGYSFAVCL